MVFQPRVAGKKAVSVKRLTHVKSDVKHNKFSYVFRNGCFNPGFAASGRRLMELTVWLAPTIIAPERQGFVSEVRQVKQFNLPPTAVQIVSFPCTPQGFKLASCGRALRFHVKRTDQVSTIVYAEGKGKTRRELEFSQLPCFIQSHESVVRQQLINDGNKLAQTVVGIP